MMNKKKTLLSWSSGKDSAWALDVLRRDPRIDLNGLFTVMNQKYKRVTIHATRLELLQQQAKAVDLPIQIIELPDPCTNEEYDVIMRRFVMAAVDARIEYIAFGDLFLEGIRKYREDQMKGTGIIPIFPLWGTPTGELAKQMISAGVEAYVSSVDLKRLPSHVAGRKWSKDLLKEFPKDCDPCGENGEIHTVVVEGPMFRDAIPVKIGKIVERNGFAYADIVPEGSHSQPRGTT